MVSLFGFGIVGVLFIVWLYRARLVAEQLCSARQRLSAGWAVGSWFLPVGNLWLPATVVIDVARASDPANAGSRGRLAGSVLDSEVRQWWGLWLASSWLLWLGYVWAASTENLSDAMLKLGVCYVVWVVLLALAAHLLTRIARQISDWQRRRLGAVSAAVSAPPRSPTNREPTESGGLRGGRSAHPTAITSPVITRGTDRPRVAPLAALHPATIGPYRLEGFLGDGVTGEMFLGRGSDDRLAAIKLVHAGCSGDIWSRVHLGEEVNAAREAPASGIVPVLDADFHAPRPWLATEYIPGPSVQQAVTEQGTAPEPTVRVLGARIADTLGRLHAHGVVHGGLKPSNVLLAADGPRLTDVGIARALEVGQGGTAAFAAPGFVSPEQARGEQTTPASDVFTLASLLVYAAAGRTPFDEADHQDAVLHHVIDRAAEPSGLPDRLRDVLAPCLANDPADRPNAAKLAGQL